MSETKVKKYGTRDQVFAGTALQTKGGLTKDDLFESNGRYVSKRASEAVKIRAPLIANRNKKNVPADTEEAPQSRVVPAAVKKIEEQLVVTETPLPKAKKTTKKQVTVQEEVFEPTIPEGAIARSRTKKVKPEVTVVEEKD